MRQYIYFAVLLLKAAVCWALLAVPAAHADMTVAYPRHESGATLHTDFYFQVLKVALERTRTEFGPYQLQYTAQGMNPARAAAELAAGSGVIHVDVRSWNEEREKTLYRVPFPVDRGLIGYRVLLIRAKDQAKFDAVRSLSDLKQFSFGLLAPWGDVRIFEHNRLPVVKGSSYEGLFRMLSVGRFDALSRDIDEILFEYERKRNELPDLAIESSLLLRYPSARYFFVSRTLEGLKLAARIEAGLQQMQEDGSFDELFRRHKSAQMTHLGIAHRRVITIENPLLPPAPPSLPDLTAPGLAEKRRKQ